MGELMSKDKKDRKKSEVKSGLGNRNFFISLSIFTFLYGSTVKIMSGYYCSACLIALPVFVLFALYEHIKNTR